MSRLLWAGTFHSVGDRILRLYAKHLGLDPNFTVLDRADAADLMDVVRHELGFSAKDKRFPRKDACLAIYSYRVNTRLSLKQTLEEQFPWCREWEADLTRLYREYVGRKQKNRALDFDDLLLYWHVMMQTPALAQSLSKNFDHVLVDEYQDTSTLQGEVIHALKPDGKGVTVVGDDAQAIYSFRAAAVENILGFADRYKPKADMVVLAQNYRSTQPVLDSANALMAEAPRQHRKTLLGTRQSQQKTFYVAMDDAQGQAEYITGKILQTREIGGSLKRHAILFRSSHHSDVLEVELTKKNIPFVKYGGSKFLEAAHVKDMLSVLRWADNPRNRIAGFRVLKLLPGFGPGKCQTGARSLRGAWLRGQEPRRLRCAAAGKNGLEAILRVVREAGRSRHALARSGGSGARTGTSRSWRAFTNLPGRAWATSSNWNSCRCSTPAASASSRSSPGSAAGDRRPIRGRLEGRGLRHPVHDSLGQGPGVGHRVCAERLGRKLSVGILHGQAGDDRGRAALAVRGHDPGPQ